jgi:hypothetical protein
LRTRRWIPATTRAARSLSNRTRSSCCRPESGAGIPVLGMWSGRTRQPRPFGGVRGCGNGRHGIGCHPGRSASAGIALRVGTCFELTGRKRLGLFVNAAMMRLVSPVYHCFRPLGAGPHHQDPGLHHRLEPPQAPVHLDQDTGPGIGAATSPPIWSGSDATRPASSPPGATSSQRLLAGVALSGASVSRSGRAVMPRSWRSASCMRRS